MSSFCFSAASILRCDSLSKVESSVLIIPTGLELVFTILLLVKKWRGAKYNLLVVLEGWLYFSLALLDLLSHNITAVRDSLTIFQAVDITLGASSSVVIFIFLLFMYLFARAEIVEVLPKGARFVVKTFILLVIPAVVVLNSMASFIGIQKRDVTINETTFLAIGFPTDADQTVWQFFTSITLAFLTGIQAFMFALTFYRLIRALVNRHYFEARSEDANHMLRGIAWLATAFKFGAIESVVGLVTNSFYLDLIRRILRLISRASLVVGLLKGVDEVEDFENFRTAMEKNKPTGLTYFISNPRTSTVQRLDLEATTAFNAGYAPKPPLTPIVEEIVNQRVTVHYQRGRAPTLRLRFSELEVPTAAQIEKSLSTRRNSYWLNRKGSPSEREPVILEFSEKSTDGTLTADTSPVVEFPRPPGMSPRDMTIARPMPQLPEAVLLAQNQPWQNQDPYRSPIAPPDHRRSSSYSKRSSTWSSMYGGSVVDIAPQPMSAVAAGKQRATHFSDSGYSVAMDSQQVPYNSYIRQSQSSFSPSAYYDNGSELQPPMPSGASAFVAQQGPAGEWSANRYPVPLMQGVANYRPGTGYEISSSPASPVSSNQSSGVRVKSAEFDKAWHDQHDDAEDVEISLAISRRAEMAEIKSLPRKRTPVPVVDPVSRVSVGVEQVLGGATISPTDEQQKNRMRYLQNGPMGPRSHKPQQVSNDAKGSLDGFGLEY